MQVPDAASYSMSLAMTFCLVLLHYRPRSYFLGSVAIASGTLRTFLDMFVLPLFLCAYAAKMFFTWHRLLFRTRFSASAHHRTQVVCPQYCKLPSIQHHNSAKIK
jgi:hypothetical protein